MNTQCAFRVSYLRILCMRLGTLTAYDPMTLRSTNHPSVALPQSHSILFSFYLINNICITMQSDLKLYYYIYAIYFFQTRLRNKIRLINYKIANKLALLRSIKAYLI